MKNKKFGFTLIELLVVIVILAIVALITTPIVLDVIEKATDKANRSSAYGIMETAKLYRIEEMFKDRPVPETNILSTLKVKGSKPKNGDVRVNNSGYIAIALQYGNKCYTKAFEDEDITVLDDFEECKLPEPPKPPFDDVKLVNRPQLTEGMTPIKWDASNNEITTNEEDDEWYDYSTKKWANVKTADGSYWVWIPRYAYKMNGGYHSNVASSFDIKFLREKTNEPTDNTTIETEGYVADLDSNASTTKNTKNFYFLHPAFQNDINAYGFWVAKFEPSVSNPIDPCYTNASTENCNNTDVILKIVPNTSSLKHMHIGNQFITAKKLKDKSVYGWDANKVDTHMMTNYEWGAVTYLSASNHGKNSEVTINSNSPYYTGGGINDLYKINVDQSTTGNVYGIYDMSGGAWEYVSAYVNNNSSQLTVNGKSIIDETDLKYKNVYKATSDGQVNNYNENKNIYGDAVWETSNNGFCNSCSWNGDFSYMPYSVIPFFTRGGYYDHGSGAGLFHFGNYYGYTDGNNTFRPVVSIK